MSRKSGNRFCDHDMRKNQSMSRKSAQRFCDNGMRKNEGLKRGKRI